MRVTGAEVILGVCVNVCVGIIFLGHGQSNYHAYLILTSTRKTQCGEGGGVGNVRVRKGANVVVEGKQPATISDATLIYDLRTHFL